MRSRLSEISGHGSGSRFHLEASFVLMLVVGAVFFLPARLVVSGLGAVGRPHLVLGAGLLLWWLACQVHPRLQTIGRFRQTMRPALVFWLVSLLLAWAAGYDRGLVPLEGSGSDRNMIANAAYLGIALTVMDGVRTRAQLDRLLRFVVLGGAFMAFMGWLQFWLRLDLPRRIDLPGLVPSAGIIGIGSRGDNDFARVAGTAGHYIEFGVVLAMILPLAIHYMFTATTKGQRQFRQGLVILIGAAIPFSVSRAGAVGLVLVLAVMLLGWNARRRLNALGCLVIGVCLFIVIKPGLLGTIRSLFTNASSDPSITGRTEDYAVAWSYVHERPWLGRGPGTFTPELYRLLDNQWLLSLVENGWIGVVGLLWLMVTAFVVQLNIRRNARRVGDEETENLALSLLAITVTVLITSYFFDSFYFTTFATVFWLAIGATGALWRLQRAELASVDRLPVPMRERLSELAAEVRPSQRAFAASTAGRVAPGERR